MMHIKKIPGAEGLRWGLLAILLALVLSAAGCNTVRGVGQDIEKAGEAIQKSTK